MSRSTVSALATGGQLAGLSVSSPDGPVVGTLTGSTFTPAKPLALAKAYTEKLFSYDPQSHWQTKASAALERALALEPSLAEAYLARGILLWTRRNQFPAEQAIAESRRAAREQEAALMTGLDSTPDRDWEQLSLVLEGIGDEAYLAPGNSALMMRKGDVMVNIDLRESGVNADAAKKMASRIADHLR